MPIEFDGPNSKVSADTIAGQGGSTITIQSGHSLSGSGSGLTALPAANLTGTLPAISGANLTALNATNLGSGTVPDARFPSTLPAASGANLTALNGSNIASGTVADARISALTASKLTGALPAIDGSNLTGVGFPVGASAYVTGGQAISHNSATTLIFNTEVYDPNNNYNTSNGTYTVPSGQAGKYLATGHISIPVVDPTLHGLGIKVNGTTKIFQGQYGGTDTGGQEVTMILNLSVSDAVTWYCHHKAGSTKTTEVSPYGTGMSIQRVA